MTPALPRRRTRKFGDQLAECLHAPTSLLNSDSDDSVDSPDFESPDNQRVSGSVAVGPSDEVAEQFFDLMEQDNASQCFGDALDGVVRQSMANDPDAPQGVTVGKLKLGELNLPQYADESVAFRATVPVSASGQSVDVSLDILFIRHARAASFLLFLGVFSPFPLEDEKHYASIAADRLSALDV